MAPNRNILSLDGLSKSHDGSPLISNISLGLDEGDRVGIIGANGAGKSTLLRLIAGGETADAGRVVVRSGTRIAFLEQLPRLPAADSVRTALNGAFDELRRCIAAYEVAAAESSDDAPELLERIEQLGGWDHDYRLESAATRVGLKDLDTPIAQLSGGESKRVALTRLILQEADLILLDEPTNHLDAEIVEWLEDWLKQTRATVVLVTHDRYFLDTVVDRLVELREGSLFSYRGNYTDYLTTRAVEEAQRERTRHRQLRVLMRELEWARRQPKARTTKSRGRLDRIDATSKEVERLTGEKFAVSFHFGEPPRLGGIILELDDVHVAYEGGPPLVSGLTLAMRKGERIGIVGPNGAGKTTLLEVICGSIEPSAGKVRIGQNTEIAYFDQRREALDDNETVRATLLPDGDRVFPGGGAGVHVGSWLDRFGFVAETHSRTVGSLSGGERNRLAIARFLLRKANLLILDEPTNDLDINTLNGLEEAIAAFDGCVLIVSHDRYLLDKVTTGILGFELDYAPPGTVTFVEGDYTHYVETRLRPLAKTKRKKAAKKRPDAPTRKSTKRSGLTYAERLELEKIEPSIEAAEATAAEIELQLADPELWSAGPKRGREVEAALSAAQAEVAQLYKRWEELLRMEAPGIEPLH